MSGTMPRRLASLDLLAAKPIPAELLVPLRPCADQIAAALQSAFGRLGAASTRLVVDGIRRARGGSDADPEDWQSVWLAGDEAGDHCVLRIDRASVFLLCEGAFGGAGLFPPFAEQRPLSETECGLAAHYAADAAAALAAYFSGQLARPVKFAARRGDGGAGQDPQPARAFEIAFICEGLGYNGEIVLEMEEPLTVALASSTLNKKKPASTDLMAGQGARAMPGAAPVELLAVLGEIELPLARVTTLRRGDVLPLGLSVNSTVSILAGSEVLLTAELARSAGHYAVVVLDTHPQQPESGRQT